jgi:hypothetical protein
MNLVEAVIAGKIEGGPGGEVTPGSVVAATAAMTPEQAAQTVENLGIPGAVYDGVDLTEKYAAKIATYTDEWAWIKARIQDGNFSGIHVGDYIPVEANSNTFKARIMGINTYKGYGDTEHVVGNHIDWMFEELWPTAHCMNSVQWNNGLIPVESVSADGTETTFTLTKEMHEIASIKSGNTTLTGWTYDSATYTITFTEAPAAGTLTVTGTGSEHPWLASEGYLWLNSLAGHVANSTDNPPATAVKHVDYTESGVYYYLPSNLKNAIVEKRFYLGKRFSASGKLSSDNAAAFTNIGKLWIPTEIEACGINAWSGTGYAIAGSYGRYPIFADRGRVLKSANTPLNWFLLNPQALGNTMWCNVSNAGSAGYQYTSVEYYYFPICFRT